MNDEQQKIDAIFNAMDEGVAGATAAVGGGRRSPMQTRHLSSPAPYASQLRVNRGMLWRRRIMTHSGLQVALVGCMH